jgi:hypothetical protein
MGWEKLQIEKSWKAAQLTHSKPLVGRGATDSRTVVFKDQITGSEVQLFVLILGPRLVLDSWPGRLRARHLAEDSGGWWRDFTGSGQPGSYIVGIRDFLRLQIHPDLCFQQPRAGKEVTSGRHSSESAERAKRLKPKFHEAGGLDP